MSDTLDLATLLSERGYRKHYQDNGTCLWQSRRDFLPLCKCDDKTWINVIVYPEYSQCEVEITAEAVDGTWFKLRAYSLSISDLPSKIADIETRLIAAWKAVAGPTP